MTNLSGLCLDLFLLAHAHLAAGLAGRGAAFERRVRAHLDGLGLPTARGFRVLGRRSMSSLYHQLDEQTACADALVIGEWKAYRGFIPKNDLLRFKAATDDYWLASTSRLSRPVMRVFGGTGRVTDAMRVYAAQWGIILVTPDAWPIPTLCDHTLVWGAGEMLGPGRPDLRCMSTLVRPLNRVLEPQADGGWRVTPMPQAHEMLVRLEVWRHWSERAWQHWEEDARGRFDALLDQRVLAADSLAA